MKMNEEKAIAVTKLELKLAECVQIVKKECSLRQFKLKKI
jgi:hypothetical protein